MPPAVRASSLVPLSNFLSGEAIGVIEPHTFSLFLAFGDYRSDQGVQCFSAAALRNIQTAFEQQRGKSSRGVPIYRGQPDVSGGRSSDPASPAFGWLREIHAANDGAQMMVTWGEGRKAVEGEQFRFFAPMWLCRRAGGGTLEPAQLVSLGLTNRVPDLPRPAAANSAPLALPGTATERSAARQKAVADVQRAGVQDFTAAWQLAASRNPALFQH